MFVKGNQLKDLRNYFSENLAQLYSATELQLILKVIVCKRLNIKEQDFALHQDLRFSESDLLHFRSLLKRLQKNEPFQYVIGETEFYGLLLKTDKRALIPRPETEELVDWVVKDYKANSAIKILDICAGSGCIGLALKNALPTAEVHALEWSEEAIGLIQENCATCDLELQIHHLNVLDSAAFASFIQESFDVWVSNPPYIPVSDRERMEANVLDFEPEMALFVPDGDPLLFYRVLAAQAQHFLVGGGNLYFELHEDLGASLVQLMEESGFVNIELRKDLQGKNRLLRAQKRNFTA